MTGATGFLGSNLLRRLLAEKKEVCLLVRSTSNFSRISDLLGRVRLFRLGVVSLPRLFSAEKIDTVLHCATNYGRRMESPVSILEANLLLPLRLLQVGADNGLRCFVNTDTILDKRVGYYSLSKNQFREWLRLYSDRLACGNVALEHFYGAGDDRSKFVAYMVDALLRGVPRIELTPGEQKRDFVHISDVVRAFSLVLASLKKRRNGFHHFEIGTGRTTSIRNFALQLKRLSGNQVTELDLGAIPYRENEVMQSSVNLFPILATGWRPRMTLRRGLMDMIRAEKKRMRE